MMTLFDYKYQNSLRQAIVFGVIFPVVKNRSCVTRITAKCILAVSSQMISSSNCSITVLITKQTCALACFYSGKWLVFPYVSWALDLWSLQHPFKRTHSILIMPAFCRSLKFLLSRIFVQILFISSCVSFQSDPLCWSKW